VYIYAVFVSTTLLHYFFLIHPPATTRIKKNLSVKELRNLKRIFA